MISRKQLQNFTLILLCVFSPSVYAGPAEDQMTEALKKLKRLNEETVVIEQKKLTPENDPNMYTHRGDLEYPIVVDGRACREGVLGKIWMESDGKQWFERNYAYGRCDVATSPSLNNNTSDQSQ